MGPPSEYNKDGEDDHTAQCLALVIDHNEISVWDVDGEVRSFVYDKVQIQDLCFSSHGQDADDLLTPCLDEDGRHGTPDEGCFCGVDAPHLHAHAYHPETCHQHVDAKSSSDMVEASLMKLARITLMPSPARNSGESVLYRLPSTKNFPRDCNAEHLPESVATKREDNSKIIRRLAPVTHHDHTDHLVHNRETGHVYVEHACVSCKAADCHGVFGVDEQRVWDNEDMGGSKISLHFYRAATLRAGDRVTSEDWMNPVIKRDTTVTPEEESAMAGSLPTCNSSSKPMMSQGDSTTKAQSCCASDASSTCAAKGSYATNAANKQPSSCCSKQETSECCGTPKESNVDACKTKSPNNNNNNNGPCCSGGNCSAEVPSKSSSCCSKEKNSCCDSVATTESLSCAAPRQSCCSTENASCEKAMDCEGESSCCPTGNSSAGCCVGHLHLEEQELTGSLPSNETSNTASKRSTFFVKEICCASEVAAIRSIVGPLEGVESIRVNVTSKMLYVNHYPESIGAQEICDVLNQEMFGARIEKDGAVESNTVSSFVTSILALEDSETSLDKDALVEFLATYDSTVVRNAIVDVHGKRITLMHNALLISADEIVKACSETLGVEAKVLKDGKESLIWEFPDVIEEENQEVVEESSESSLRPTVVVSGFLWLVSMLSFIGGNWEYLKYVALLSVVFGLPPIAMKALVTLRGCRFDVNCLMSFAAIGAVALQEFTEAAAVTFLFALSEWLEARATSRARNALSAILELRPEKANLIHPQTGELVVVPVGVVPVGALVSVRAGDKIPCDGVVMEGCSTVDESSLTGESRPVRKGPNDIVSGGTINCGNTQMTVRTTASAEDSAVARLIRLVEEAQANRSETEKLVDQFAAIYTPVVVFIAIGMCTIPWAWGREVGTEWTELGLVLIVVACPCALIISTPVSYVAGLAASAQQGILIKGGAHLEALGLVKTVCFDKTGTLTEGKFQLLHFDVLGQAKTRKEALEYLALLEERASHPLAQALVEGARNEGVEIPRGRFVRNHTFLAGEGVSGTIDGDNVHVGNVRLFERLGLYQELSELERKMVEEWETTGTVGFMSVGRHGIICAYCVADAIRPESARVLRKLKELGIDGMMLTGDKKETAMSIGLSIGFTEKEIKSELFPEEKLSIVSDLKDSRPSGQSILANICSTRRLCLMIGDGVNDAPALAIADIGVAVAGSALAMETADVTLLDSHLDKLVYCIKMGRSVIRKIKENVIFSLAVKFLVLGFALAGRAALWAAIASDVGAMLLVTLNSMMLLPRSGAKTDLHLEEGVKERKSESTDENEELEKLKLEKASFAGRSQHENDLLSVAST